MEPTLYDLVQARASGVWRTLQRIHPELIGVECPAIRLNNRLWRTAGRCFQELHMVELATKFFVHSDEYRREMFRVIIPHEVIHAADWALYGESDKKCGHGRTWQQLMLDYGLEPDTYHYMEIKR